MGVAVHSAYAMTGCGFTHMMPQEVYLAVIRRMFGELRSQYLALSVYDMYDEIYVMALVPIAIFLGCFFLVGHKAKKS